MTGVVMRVVLLLSFSLMTICEGAPVIAPESKPRAEYAIDATPIRTQFSRAEPIIMKVTLRNVGKTPFLTHPFLLSYSDIEFTVRDSRGKVIPLPKIGITPSSLEFVEGDVISSIRARWPVIVPGSFVGASFTFPLKLPPGKYSAQATYRLWSAASWDAKTIESLQSELEFPLPLDQKASPIVFFTVM
jgi:hypothetical protein